MSEGVPGRAELILASGSAGRADILRGAGLTFRQMPAAVDERALEAELTAANGAMDGGKLARMLAAAKAEHVSAKLSAVGQQNFPAALVAGVDQVMECGGTLYHKPSSRAEARQHLAALRGKTHSLHCGLCIAQGGRAVWQHLAVARMTMRPFSDAFLDAYCATEDEVLLQTVGAYRIEGRGVQLFSGIEGDHFTIIGLPLLPLLGYLRDIGWLPA
jgi:septum formation protein